MDAITRPAPILSADEAASVAATHPDNRDRAIAPTIMPCVTWPMAVEPRPGIYAKSTCWRTRSEAARAGMALSRRPAFSQNWKKHCGFLLGQIVHDMFGERR